MPKFARIKLPQIGGELIGGPVRRDRRLNESRGNPPVWPDCHVPRSVRAPDIGVWTGHRLLGSGKRGQGGRRQAETRECPERLGGSRPAARQRRRRTLERSASASSVRAGAIFDWRRAGATSAYGVQQGNLLWPQHAGLPAHRRPFQTMDQDLGQRGPPTRRKCRSGSAPVVASSEPKRYTRLGSKSGARPQQRRLLDQRAFLRIGAPAGEQAARCRNAEICTRRSQGGDAAVLGEHTPGDPTGANRPQPAFCVSRRGESQTERLRRGLAHRQALAQVRRLLLERRDVGGHACLGQVRGQPPAARGRQLVVPCCRQRDRRTSLGRSRRRSPTGPPGKAPRARNCASKSTTRLIAEVRERFEPGGERRKLRRFALRGGRHKKQALAKCGERGDARLRLRRLERGNVGQQDGEVESIGWRARLQARLRPRRHRRAPWRNLRLQGRPRSQRRASAR